MKLCDKCLKKYNVERREYVKKNYEKLRAYHRNYTRAWRAKNISKEKKARIEKESEIRKNIKELRESGMNSSQIAAKIGIKLSAINKFW